MQRQNFNEELVALLKTHPDFTDESSELIPAAFKYRACQLNHNLIKLLLSDPEIKTTFFDEIDGHWVFNHNTFIDYIAAKNFLAKDEINNWNINAEMPQDAAQDFITINDLDAQ